jgi:hypothetical protein
MSAHLNSFPTRSLPGGVAPLLLVLLLLVLLLVPVPRASTAATPSCVPTPGVSPITTISVACSTIDDQEFQLGPVTNA